VTTEGNGVQWADVTTASGTLTIWDGTASGNLTGNITWGRVSTYEGVGGLNAGLTVNVTGLHYSGAKCASINNICNGIGVCYL
jgi:hypothetical protein